MRAEAQDYFFTPRHRTTLKNMNQSRSVKTWNRNLARLCRGAALALSIALCLFHVGNPASARAAITVDWLSFAAGANSTHFSLKDDGGLTVAQAEVQLTSGTLAPLSPSAGLLQAPFWVTAPAFTDSLLGNASVATSKVQVAPQAGSVQYKLAITGQDLSGFYFSVGQLFSNGTAGTLQINIAAKTGAGAGVPVDFLGTNGWDDGIRSYTQELSWDSALAKLLLSAGSSGESKFAFFHVETGADAVTSLTFDIPSGYNSGLGDALEFALAKQSVPEPASAVLWLSGSAVFLFSRAHRRRAWR